MRGFVVVALGAILIWIGLSTDGSKVDAADVALGWLADSPRLDAPASVELLVGTTERRARLAPIGASVESGAEGFARLHVEGEPLPLLPGDRFVLRSDPEQGPIPVRLRPTDHEHYGMAPMPRKDRRKAEQGCARPGGSVQGRAQS